MTTRKLVVLVVISTIVAIISGEIFVRWIMLLISITSYGSDNAMAYWLGALFIVRPLLASTFALTIIIFGLFTPSYAINLQTQKFLISVFRIAAMVIFVLAITSICSILLSSFEFGIDPFSVWSIWELFFLKIPFGIP